MINFLEKTEEMKKTGISRLKGSTPGIAVGMGTCGIGNGADRLYDLFNDNIRAKGLNILLRKIGCIGYCAEEPIVNVYMPGSPLVLYRNVQKSNVKTILNNIEKQSFRDKNVMCKISRWDHHTGEMEYGEGFPKIAEWNEIPFFRHQKKIVLRNAGLIDPDSMEEYLAVGGYSAFLKAIREMKPEEVIAEVKESRLRGRGGAGFPTGIKWELMRNERAAKKYIICNADEGDPGAYMNRNEIESDPHMLLEGMLLGAYAMGAEEGIIYVRAEYPLAVERLNRAIDQAEKAGFIGSKIPGTNFRFKLNMVEGAGAFVCGEETALIASAEGKSGRPTPRPPFPAQSGFMGYPTNINNVETWCNIPVIVLKGADWFTRTGTEKSSGTKVFSLVGKVKNTGLVELPLGETLTTLVYEIGGGASGEEKRIKAVQSGGPSGGCIPIDKFGTPVDYESLASIGAIMGSGGMVVMDQDNCMVDVARYFLEFTNSESCGKCVPCREGLAQELFLLDRITNGDGRDSDLAVMEELGVSIMDTALCGLGQTAPNPVLTTLKYFRKEYEEHIHMKHCSSGTCEALFTALCTNSCPLHMNIPAYLELVKENRLEEAFESTLRDNPLPGTIGRICHFHCQMRCRRETIDEPVHQGEIHRYLADTMYKMGRENQIYETLINEKLHPTGKEIAIVGSGPAGLTAAFYLVRLGHDVTVYDAHPKAGGILRYGIPSYRLPKEVLDKELEIFKILGVKFAFNKTLGTDIHLDKLVKDNDKVFLGIGSYHHIDLNIPGHDLKGVIQGTELLENIEKKRMVPLGKKIAVIGGGNVAIDAARSLWRVGTDVTIVYRRAREDMPANRQEIHESETEGINFIFMAAPLRIVGNSKGEVEALEVMEMKGGDYDISGRRRPVRTDRTFMVPCDVVVLAVGEKVDSGLLQRQGIRTTEEGNALINQYTYKTNNDSVYAAGDIITGPSTAAEAMGFARNAAEAMDLELTGEKRFGRLFKAFEFSHEPPEEIVSGKRMPERHLHVDARRGNFQEVNRGYMGDQARTEAMRCLRCDIKPAARGMKK